MKHKITRSIMVGLIVLLFVGLIPATSADEDNYVKFSELTVDCVTPFGSFRRAQVNVEWAITAGSRRIQERTGSPPFETLYAAPSSFTGIYSLFVIPGSSAELIMTLYNPDGSLAAEAIAHVECPSGEAVISNYSFMPGCELALPDNAVVGTFTQTTAAYWAPGQKVEPEVMLEGGKSALVLGQDASGEYYKIKWACQYLWVPVNSMGPNYDAVWNGTPLPTSVVD